MTENRLAYKVRIGLFLILLLFLAGIGYVSNQPSSEQDIKDQIRGQAWMIKAVDHLPPIRINYEGRMIDSRQDTVRFIQFGIRKVIHFVTYGLLGLLVFWNLSAVQRGRLSRYILAGVCVLAVAVLDEWHQLSVPGRCGLVYDVIVDLAGFICFSSVHAFFSRSKHQSGTARKP